MNAEEQSIASATPTASWYRRHHRAVLGWGGITLFLLLLLALGQLQRHFTQQKIDTKLAAIHAQFYPLNLAELDAWYLTPPDQENAAIEIIAASRQITDYWTQGGQWMDPNYSNNLHTAELPLTLPARAALASIIQSNQPALHLIRTGLAKPQCRYPVDYAKYDLGTIHSIRQQIMEVQELLRWETFHYQAEGQAEAALESLTTRLRLADTLSTDPSTMSLLLRNGIRDSTLRGLSRQLSAAPASSNTLARLTPLLLQLDQQTSLARALAGERVYHLEIESSEDIASGVYYQTPFDDWPTNLHSLGPLIYKHGGYALPDRLHYLELLSSALKSIETSSTDALNFANDTAALYPIDAKPAWSYVRTSNTAGTLPFIIRTTLSFQTQCRLARVAVAVEQYWNQHGKLPADMTDLLPDYLDKIPADPFSGSGVLYQRTADGYRIYSLGEDGLDDGGKDYRERLKPLTHDLVFKVENANRVTGK